MPIDIRAIRKKHGLTRIAVKTRLGVRTETVWRWETGRVPIPPSKEPFIQQTLDAMIAERKAAGVTKPKQEKVRADKDKGNSSTGKAAKGRHDGNDKVRPKTGSGRNLKHGPQRQRLKKTGRSAR